MEFLANDVRADAPEEICATCAQHGLRHEPTAVELVFCIHSRTGAFRALGRAWRLVRGLTPENFRDGVVRGLVRGELMHDVVRGIQARLEQEARTSQKH
jgi:hypothetical protein